MALPARDTRSLMPTPMPATTRYACWWTASTMFPRRRAFTLRSPAPSVRCFRRPPSAATEIRWEDFATAPSNAPPDAKEFFEPNLYIYDAYPGGIGFSEPLYRI